MEPEEIVKRLKNDGTYEAYQEALRFISTNGGDPLIEAGMFSVLFLRYLRLIVSLKLHRYFDLIVSVTEVHKNRLKCDEKWRLKCLPTPSSILPGMRRKWFLHWSNLMIWWKNVCWTRRVSLRIKHLWVVDEHGRFSWLNTSKHSLKVWRILSPIR